MMLFLGAGASKRFGITTMDEMSREFENNVDRLLNDAVEEQSTEKQLYQEIRNTLGTNDLEDILTVLNDLSEEVRNPSVKFLKSSLIKWMPLIPLKNMQGRVIAREKFIPSIFVEVGVAKKLQLKIIQFIKENCVLKEEEEKLRDIIRVYDQLFEILKCNSSSIFDIFTTNYDLIIEKYYDLHTQEYNLFSKKYDYVENLRRISYTDGFFSIAFTASGGSIDIADGYYAWNPKRYAEIIRYANNKDIPTIKLFKLHGSIDQYIEGDKIVKRDILYPIPTASGEERLESMIYPMREKEVYKDPFFELFTRLKTNLLSEKICIVIGYSFGDEHIRNIFFDAVKRNPKVKILLGNKKPDEVMKNLEPIKDNIIPIEGEFGKESFFERLKEELEKCKNNS
jgi:hypothetical protein